MARRPSTVSLSSVGSGTGLHKLSQLPPIPGPSSRSVSSKSHPNGSPSISRTVSAHTQPDHGKGNEFWDPDELFTKHTVNEVRSIQQRLRADADAKKEELRLMVGERYRDLLQASTSIISIADSSGRVVDALAEMRDITSSIQKLDSPKTSGGAQGDNSLPTLQSLAAHLKLLLDSPEHLWRLLERKSYLFAAWLFLLSRVVHRSLLRTNDDDDDALDWESLGIDIIEQFPLVQRQWDAISQFRSQITHKATLSLREPNLSPTDVCAIMLALHLLESKPFPETLSSFLAQRSKSLSVALSRPKERAMNGSALDPLSSSDGTAKKPKSAVLEVRRKLKAVLDIVCRTLCASRAVLLRGQQGQDPLMLRVLQHIQDEDPGLEAELPSELRLTSQSLLSTLPSSNHFLLLPSSIRAYKPYVEDASLSPPEKQAQIARKLGDWSRTALQNIQTAMTSWFSELTTIRELWQLRAWCRGWLEKSQGLEDEERVLIHSSVDSICRQKAVELWKTALDSTKSAFHKQLEDALSLLSQTSDSHSYEIEPARYLLRAPPLPSASQLASTSSSAPFHTYTSNLRLQISGRTPLSREVLESLENSIKLLRDELGAMTGDNNTSKLSSQLIDLYRADAESLCDTVCDCLRSTIDNLDPTSDADMHAIAFIGRLALELSSMADSVTSIGCSEVVADDFRDRLKGIHADVTMKWQHFVVDRTFSPYWSSIRTSSHASPQGAAPKPSSALIVALQSLATAVQQLGALSDPTISNDRARTLLRAFAEAFAEKLDDEPIPPGSVTQLACDLALLHVILDSWGPAVETTSARVLAAAQRSETEDFDRIRDGANSYMARIRMLLGMLLPPATDKDHLPGASKGISTDAHHQSALELVKPSARFGLLLVGSSVSR